jgi:EAL domain-containing protein (putative c-di-GMP-specific phosphodiesterase class I)
MTDAVRAYLDNLVRDPLRDDLRVTDGGRVVGRFLRCEIDSVFQPVARLAGDAITGAHALARVHAEAGAALSPWNLFAQTASGDDLVLLDRRCRIVHTLNFFRSPTDALAALDLLLNVHPRLLTVVSTDHGRAFRRVLDSLQVDSRQVVISLPPVSRGTLDLQCQVAGSYRLNGFRVAVSGEQPAMLQSLLARQPADVIRIDAHRLAGATWRPALALAQAVGADVHATRVEDDAQRALALQLGATHWQGWHLAQPAADFIADVQAA